MPPLRPSGTTVRAVQRSIATTQTPKRSLSSTAPARSAHGGDYDPPTGWLWGVKPGEKYQNEGWEKPFFWGFCGSLLVAACVLPFKPDTS
jgi:hypothetical protein